MVAFYPLRNCYSHALLNSVFSKPRSQLHHVVVHLVHGARRSGNWATCLPPEPWTTHPVRPQSRLREASLAICNAWPPRFSADRACRLLLAPLDRKSVV